MLDRQFTFVEVKGKPPVTRDPDFGINYEAKRGCFNLVIPDQVCHHLAMSIVEEKGFEPTGTIRYS